MGRRNTENGKRSSFIVLPMLFFNELKISHFTDNTITYFSDQLHVLQLLFCCVKKMGSARDSKLQGLLRKLLYTHIFEVF